jgi:hypothetical protein
MSNVVFDNMEFNLGDVHYKSVINLEADCLENADRVHYINGGCWCTKPSFDGKNLKIEFNVEAAVGNLQKGEYKSVPKYVDIYLDKEVNHYVPDPHTMKMINNPDKVVIKIPINFRAHGDLG